jgi:hypothetical protein
LNSSEKILFLLAATEKYSSGNGLTRIDTKFLKELRMVVKLPEAQDESPNQTETRLFKRVSSTPKDTARDIRRAFSKTDTIRVGTSHGEEEKNIHLFLGANSIASIPRELFMLTNLVTLSLSAFPSSSPPSCLTQG